MWSTRVSHKMSDHLEYLEGDVEDFEDIEGDVDLSEWASMGDDGTALNVKHSGKDFGVATGKHKPQTSQNNNARQSSVTQGNQSSIPKQPGTSPSVREAQKSGTSPSVREAQKSGTSPSVRGAQKSGIQSKTYTSQTSGNAGYSDIAGAIQSSGPHAPLSVGKFSRSFSDREQESKAQQKNQQNVAGMKRKTDSNLDQEKEGAKQRRVESDSDILMIIEDDGSKGDAGSVTVEDRDRIEKKSSLTQEEMRQLDASLVDEMMDGIKRQMFLRLDRGDRYVVTFGPLELADLAHSSVQQLIESEPNLAFFFKRQGKFKKKKGYAQVYFHLTSEVRQFIEMLMYVKLSETRTDVSIAALMNTGKQTAQVSFVFSSNNSSKLMDLLKKEDPSRPSPLATKASFQVEKVSTETTSTLLILLFPFASSISFNYDQSKDVGPGYKGPVNVFYLNQRWMDAVLACCSDFKFNDLTLTLLLPGQQQQQSVPKALPQRRASRTDGVSCSANVDKPSTAEDKPSTSSQEDNTSGNRSRHVSSGSAKSGSEGADDDISNMTLDVCAGMMESLDKLKQMGTDNPDVLKILEYPCTEDSEEVKGRRRGKKKPNPSRGGSLLFRMLEQSLEAGGSAGGEGNVLDTGLASGPMSANARGSGPLVKRTQHQSVREHPGSRWVISDDDEADVSQGAHGDMLFAGAPPSELWSSNWETGPYPAPNDMRRHDAPFFKSLAPNEETMLSQIQAKGMHHAILQLAQGSEGTSQEHYDEIVLRFLKAQRAASLSYEHHDPALVPGFGNGSARRTSRGRRAEKICVVPLCGLIRKGDQMTHALQCHLPTIYNWRFSETPPSLVTLREMIACVRYLCVLCVGEARWKPLLEKMRLFLVRINLPQVPPLARIRAVCEPLSRLANWPLPEALSSKPLSSPVMLMQYNVALHIVCHLNPHQQKMFKRWRWSGWTRKISPAVSQAKELASQGKTRPISQAGQPAMSQEKSETTLTIRQIRRQKEKMKKFGKLEAAMEPLAAAWQKRKN